MDGQSTSPRGLDPRKRDEWVGVNFLLGEVEGLRERGLILDEASRTIVEEYSARREVLEKVARFESAIQSARDLGAINPKDALVWAIRARDLYPDRREGWVIGVQLLRRLHRYDEADNLQSEAEARFPDLARPKLASRVTNIPTGPLDASGPVVPSTPPVPKIQWSRVAGEFLEEHWQKLISCLAVLLIVVSSTVGASLVLGPLVWSPAGKIILALVFTAMTAGFGVGLVKWGAERAGQMILATSLILIPINLILVGDLGLLFSPSAWNLGLVAVEVALLGLMARWVVGALGIGSSGTFTGLFLTIALFNAGASRGMPFSAGFPVFLAPSAIFLGAVAWLDRRVATRARAEAGEEPVTPHFAYLEFALLAFVFVAGVLWTGAAVLHLIPALYAIPVMLAATAVVSTARAIGSIEKEGGRSLPFLQGGLTLSALGFGLALASPPVASSLYSGNKLGVAILGLALYATSLRATRKPAYLYCGFAALFLAYFGAFYFAKDLVHSVEEAARSAMGYAQPLPLPFKAINGLVFSVALAWLSRFFSKKWSDERLAKHCHYIGLPLSVGACVFSGFEPKAAVICLGGYAILYAIATRVFLEPRLIYLACAAVAGSAYFGASLARPLPLGLQSVLAASLGLAFWLVRALPILRRAGETYQTPLIHSSRALAVGSMAAATLASLQDGLISPLATLAFLLTGALTLLNGIEAPRASIYYLALASLLGSWLGGYHLLNGQEPATLMAYGLVVACYSLAILGGGEASRAWRNGSKSTTAYLEALDWTVPLVVLLAWFLAGWNLVDRVVVARSFLVGSVAMLWLTRFRRDPTLVYLALSGLAIWVACLCGLVVPPGHQGLVVSWLAATMGGWSLVYWGVGEWSRRRDHLFYSDPCFVMAGVLAGLASALAFEGWWLWARSYPVGLTASLLGTVAFGLVAASKRSRTAVSLAIASGVSASVLLVLAQGMNLDRASWWLAFAFAAEAIVCRGIGGLVRKFSGETGSKLARPLDYGALILAIAAIPGGFQSPTILLLLAASSVLMIGCFPAAGWLYATYFAVGSAIFHQFLVGSNSVGLLAFAMGGAYLAWASGVALLRFGPVLRTRFGWADLAFERPAFHATMALGALALLIRFKTIVDDGGVWTTRAWFPWSVALLCLLMLRFQPKGRGWVHAAAGFASLGFTALLAPVMDPRVWWVSAGLARSLFLAVAAMGAIRGEASFRRRLGIARGFDAEVFREWALAMFGLSSVGLVAIVLGATLDSFDAVGSFLPGGWPDVMVGIALAGLFVGLEGARLDREGRWIGLEVVGLLALWWLGASASPLPVAIDRNSALALGTSAFAVGVVLLGFERSRRSSIRRADPLFDPGPEPRVGLRGFTPWFGFALGLATVYLSVFTEGRVAFPSLLLTTGSLGLLALGWRRLESAILGGVTWCLAVPVGFVLVFKAVTQDAGSGVSLGMASALFSLWALAGWVRRRAVEKGGDPSADGRVASAFEWVAIAATFPTAVFSMLDGGWHLTGSVVFFGLAVFYAAVAWRRRADWPVYLAQGFLLGAYFRVRDVLIPSSVADAVVLSLLAYLDLGLSELLGRFRLDHFARPTLQFAMVLPLVPIIQGFANGRGDSADLFVLLASGGFYALASFKLASKTPAYAAAVLFNAFLWLAWSRVGWRFADRPQFYLIPVGFSSILFAEVNRNALSRSVVNGARNLGLVVIYASLAAPIWETQSFGAWLSLLLLSLIGIFAGIGLRIQSFLWLGLFCFLADITYQVARMGMDNALARWGVMLSLGVGLILFVALNEKKRIVATLRDYYAQARTWE